MKYHVFFTTKYTDECLKAGKFGATSVNSLGAVTKEDIAFLFDGLRWNIYGPLTISSQEQFYDNSPIYGTNKRGIVNYPNRVSFTKEIAKELSLTELFAIEDQINTSSFITNRIIQSVIIANKQIHSTPLTNKEGEYLAGQLECTGQILSIPNKLMNGNYPTVIKNFIAQKKNKSEALFELLLLKGRYNNNYFNLSDYDVVFNQFVLGFQRQTDILAIKQGKCLLLELKKKDNSSDPHPQIQEYLSYIKSDSRLKPYNLTEVNYYSLLEEGNKYVQQAPNILKFVMTKDYKLIIDKP